MERRSAAALYFIVVGVLAFACRDSTSGHKPFLLAQAAVRPSLEDTLPDGSPFNPSTQSFLRGNHWLEGTRSVEIQVDDRLRGDLRLEGAPGADRFQVLDLPFDQLVPRLHYQPAAPPDEFDAFNLMMAEFSRNGLSVPHGETAEPEARFVTSLTAEAPWTLSGDYQFDPNPRLRPMRFSVVNNCLAAGLWEFSAVDRAGEIYKAWFDFPRDEYIQLVARTNGLPDQFVNSALNWNTNPAPLQLERLRSIVQSLGRVDTAVLPGGDESAGYSTQDSRQKVSKAYARIGDPANLQGVKTRADLTSGLVYMRDFVPPGKYSLERDKTFDLRFLNTLSGADVRIVDPKTSYRFNAESEGTEDSTECYIEIVLHLDGYDMILGNLPMQLLVPNEDFGINGFGVGILESTAFSERRNLLLENGPAPSFAYLAVADGDQWRAVNSHELGIEQVFIRAHAWEERPWWEITVGSFERIVDVIKYRVDIPEALCSQTHQAADTYIAPLYLTYRDDNLR